VSASSTRPLASSAEAAPDEAPAPGDGLEASYGPGLRVAGLVGLVVVVLDQLAKEWALDALADGPIEVIGSLQWNLGFNSGTAFSFGEGRGGLISLLGLVAVLVLLAGVLRWPGRLPKVAAGLVVGGALGNLYDRFTRGPGLLDGAVVDFIDVQWWPIFNIADIAICVGAGLLAILSFRNP
jgi:signal peptidase II